MIIQEGDYSELHLRVNACTCLPWSYPITTTVAKTNVFPFACTRNICCGHKFCVRDTKNVSEFVQKHFVTATNVSQFVQPKKHHRQQAAGAKMNDTVVEPGAERFMCYMHVILVLFCGFLSLFSML